jgi:hypothetical protein
MLLTLNKKRRKERIRKEKEKKRVPSRMTNKQKAIPIHA